MIVLPFVHADLNLPSSPEGAPKRSSISGVQDKVELSRRRGIFSVVESGGEYILKPVPSMPLPKYQREVPTNEEVTMRLAAKVFGIRTAQNEIVSFKDGELAYLTRRFDYRDGLKLRQEDFCQLSGRTARSHGIDYKYQGSYEECAEIVRRFCPAYRIELPKLFRRILFCYVFSNGDAQLKNFSLLESPQGDMILSPAYDLVATSVHIPNESPLALDLFADGHFTAAFETLGFYSAADFIELGEKFGIPPEGVRAEIQRFLDSGAEVGREVEGAYLSEAAKADYLAAFHNRLKAIGQ